MSNSDSNSNYSKVAAVAIVGGTHGNELTGVHLVKHWQNKQRQENFLGEKYPALQIEMLLANEEAINANKRYMEKDLNRCFQVKELKDPAQSNKEQLLAKQINQMLGPKGDSRVDLIIDLHTSTAKMQTNIVIIKMDRFHLLLAAYIKQQIPDAVITSESRLMEDHHFLCSIAEKSIVVEVGAIAQGTLDWDIYNKTDKALKRCLDFVEIYNANLLDKLGLPNELEVISYFDKVYFPKSDSGEINACVHPDLIGKDYGQIKEGTAIFKDFDGKDIFYSGQDAHVAFVNEAAYYDQKIAMCLCNPITYDLKTLQPVCK